MLVLFAITYISLKHKIDVQQKEINEKKIIDAVVNTLTPLKKDSLFFEYEPKYKRFTLRFEVQFVKDKYNLSPGQLLNYDVTVNKIEQAGEKLKNILDTINFKKVNDKSDTLRNVTYLLVIAGYASHTGNMEHNYLLSYQRAYSLWGFWKAHGIDFEDSKFKGLVDLQISGDGWGGVGRMKPDYSPQNQRFIIMLMPKIGDLMYKE